MTTPVPLGDVCDILSGGTPLRSRADYYGGEIPWAKISDIEAADGTIYATEEQITHAGLRAIRGRLFPKGTLLFAMYGSIGKMAFAGRDLATNQAILGIRVVDSERVCARFIYHWLAANRTLLLSQGQGIAQKNLSATFLRELDIPMPSLDEQHKISAILDQANDLRRGRRLAIEHIKTLQKSLFADICVTDGSTRQVPFVNVAYFQEGPGVRNWQFRDTGIKLVNVKNIVNGKLDVSNTARYLDDSEVRGKYSHFLLNSGDLVMASSGVTWGKVAEVGHAHLPLCLNTSMIRIRPINSVRKSFIRAFIENGTFRSQIERLITGSAQPNFGPSHLRQVVVPLPSIEAQERYDQSAAKITELLSRALEHVRKLDDLFASLQYRAFAGTLTPLPVGATLEAI